MSLISFQLWMGAGMVRAALTSNTTYMYTSLKFLTNFFYNIEHVELVSAVLMCHLKNDYNNT